MFPSAFPSDWLRSLDPQATYDVIELSTELKFSFTNVKIWLAKRE